MPVEYRWPEQGKTAVVGHEQDRIDGLAKASGTAKYSYDINTKQMLIARMLGCPHAHCRIKSIDVSPALQVAGVVAAKPMKEAGAEIQWPGEPLAVVAAETEAAASEGAAAVQVEYELLDVYVDDTDRQAAEAAGRTAKGGQSIELEREPGEDEDEAEFEEREIQRLLDEAAKEGVVVEADYGIHAITHMCLEPHGSTCEWQGDKLTAHLSTQNVSGTAGQFAGPLGITADDVTVHCDFIGGGFGSKFSPDAWGVVCAQLARETGRGVKLMLTREQELKIAGARPSGFIHVRVGANKDGVVTVWDSHHWGTGGPDSGSIRPAVVPYVFAPPNRRAVHTVIKTNTGPFRAWRAPDHPQACALSQTAYDDIAWKLKMDSYEVFRRNLHTTRLPDVYAAEMEIAARLIGWKEKYHLHGQGPAEGSVVTGLGMALHTWGGAAHDSTCLLRIHPDGGVETSLGSQDIGTGTRTVIAMVVAETLGLPVNAVKVNIGNSKYPPSGPSGGSTTVGGVAESNRRAAQDALVQIFDLVAKKLNVSAEKLVAAKGRIHVSGKPDQGLSWKEACSLLGMKPLEVRGSYSRRENQPSKLSSETVGGVQMAEVAVDKRTGVVQMRKFVAVQDMGLIINPKTARSQVYGAVIMGIAYALFEERIIDRTTGEFLNCEIADYRLPRLGDIGEIVVELYQPESEYSRGVVGLGEPPVISPGAAISNAVANALGVRVPVLPLTPQRVLEAIKRSNV
jgi:xanthine dehydrogenase YagR molybdenum-binding subunit